MKKKILAWLPLIGIFILALALRILLLPAIPNGLHQDELNAGYQGYKILHTGRDLQGNFLPLYINSFGDYRPAGIFYIGGLSTTLFGLTTFAIRFPAAFFGALTIFPVFFLGFFLSKRKAIGYLAALFIAISPWHIVTSRATSEQIIALFLIISGIALLLKALEEKKIRLLLTSGILLLLSYFFYHTPRVFVPLFLTFFTGIFLISPFLPSSEKKNLMKKPLILLVVIVWLITIGLTFTKFGVGRFSQTSVFSSSGTIDKIKALSDIDQNITTARIFHNKAAVYTKVVLDQFLSYFSTDFLFVKGGYPERYVVPDMGLFYYIELPLLLLGFYFLIRRKDTFFIVPLLWLLCGPLAASVTTEDIPNIQRALFMLPGFQILEAYGLYYVYQYVGRKKKILFILLFAIGVFVNMIYFIHQYVIHSPSYVAYRRDDGTVSLFQNLSGKETHYAKIYLSSYQDMPLYYFFLRGGSTHLAQFNRNDIDKGFGVGKYIFVPDECPERIIALSQLKEQKSLVVDFGTCVNEDKNLHEIERVYRRDGTTAYMLKEVY